MEAQKSVSLAQYIEQFKASPVEFRKEVAGLVKLSEKAKAAREEASDSFKPLGLQFAVLAKRHAELSATPEWSGKELPEFIRSFLGYSKDQGLPPKGFEFSRVVLALVCTNILAETDYNACSNEALGLVYKILKAEKFASDAPRVKLAVEVCQKRADKYVKQLRLILEDTVPAEDKMADAQSELNEILAKYGPGMLLATVAALARTTENVEIARSVLSGMDAVNDALFAGNTIEVKDGETTVKLPRFSEAELTGGEPETPEVKLAAHKAAQAALAEKAAEVEAAAPVETAAVA